MPTVLPPDMLDRARNGALLVMYGSPHCGVCTVMRPRIEALLAQRFPGLPLAYLSCEDAPETCAQHGVFSLPAIKLFLDGRVWLEMARSFSLKELEAGLERSYAPWRDSRPSSPPT